MWKNTFTPRANWINVLTNSNSFISKKCTQTVWIRLYLWCFLLQDATGHTYMEDRGFAGYSWWIWSCWEASSIFWDQPSPSPSGQRSLTLCLQNHRRLPNWIIQPTANKQEIEVSSIAPGVWSLSLSFNIIDTNTSLKHTKEREEAHTAGCWHASTEDVDDGGKAKGL